MLHQDCKEGRYMVLKYTYCTSYFRAAPTVANCGRNFYLYDYLHSDSDLLAKNNYTLMHLFLERQLSVQGTE